MNTYEKEITSLLMRLAANDWHVTEIDDGGEDGYVDQGSFTEAVKTITSVDDSKVRMTNKKDKRQTCLYIVLGNEPGYAVCDYVIVGDDFDALIDAHAEQWEENNE